MSDLRLSATAVVVALLIGACGPSGGSGSAAPSQSAADGAQPVVLASGQGGPVHIAVDGTSVYWTDCGVGSACTVMKVPLGGGTPIALASDQKGIFGIALDSASVYWVTDVPTAGRDRVMKVALGGGAPVVLATSGNLDQIGLTVGPAGVYWTPDKGAGIVVERVPLGGGRPTTLVPAKDFFSPDRSPNGVIAVDATSIYVTGTGTTASGTATSTIFRIPLKGGAPVVLASGLISAVTAIVVDSTSVYWAHSSDGGMSNGTVMRMPKAGGKIVTLASRQVTGPFGLAVDATSVYWTSVSADPGWAGGVMKVPLNGGAPAALASGLPGPLGIAVDASYVYWTNSDGTVMRAPK